MYWGSAIQFIQGLNLVDLFCVLLLYVVITCVLYIIIVMVVDYILMLVLSTWYSYGTVLV